jgi:hypothetical protein
VTWLDDTLNVTDPLDIDWPCFMTLIATHRSAYGYRWAEEKTSSERLSDFLNQLIGLVQTESGESLVPDGDLANDTLVETARDGLKD